MYTKSTDDTRMICLPYQSNSCEIIDLSQLHVKISVHFLLLLLLQFVKYNYIIDLFVFLAFSCVICPVAFLLPSHKCYPFLTSCITPFTH